MEYMYIGDIVNTHGVKGEVRIISDVNFKKAIFVKNRKLYIGINREEQEINTYRPHKIYDMVTFNGITDINDVLCYKGDSVYVNKKDIKIDGYFNEDLIGLDVYYNDVLIGKIDCILKSKAHDILSVIGENKCLIPYVSEFVSKIDLEKRRIDVINIEGLINEN